MFGPVGGSTGGPVPSRRWRLPYGTVVVTRTSWTVSATWSPPDRRWAAAAEAVLFLRFGVVWSVDAPGQ
ncbi:hypothetical protein [Catellatospora coxensis]|uniref:Uncharacterized protein n=1 Tax=Catellatospora coxensis TaxID=310354 RepID=A0A8J3L328_9ACTN|nr:hypothetical protein Cco03nite_75880 [Catellatospora coxensis]